MARVLIVDDVESIRVSLGAFVERDGHHVSVAGNAAEALALLREESFDVVVTDIILPRRTGVALLGDIRDAQPDVQVIMVTGEPEIASAAEAVRKGAFDYLSKPISREDITRTVSAAAAKKALLDKNRHLEEENRKHREHLEELVAERTEQLRDSELRYRNLFTNTADPILVFDAESNRFLDCNQSALDRYGYSIDELRDMTPHDLHPVEEKERVGANIADAEDISVNTYTHTTKDGTQFPVEVHTTDLEYQGRPAWISIVRDISERKQAQQRTKRLLDQQIAINELSLALGEKRDLGSIYHTIYEHVSRMMDTQAFIVSFYEGETNLIRAGYVLHEGQELDTGSFPPIPLEEEGRGTQSQVIRTGKPLYFPDYDAARIRTEPRAAYDVTVTDGLTQTVKATRGEERSSPSKSVLYVPMKIEGAVIGVLQVQSLAVAAYSKDDEGLLAGLANVAAIAIQNSRLTSKALADAAELRAAFAGTIEALARATELRDPYTAGHQIRVAELASAIAEELRLPAETIELIQVSAMVHDIGKLAVPAEILSKPSTLSETERHLIQAHVQTAYDILRTIDFPWPVAEIVLKHHEHLDGSGYPNGLKGDEIPLEVRIICVADLVEAMSSHRPYRPALGIDAALEEIKSKRGTRYDSDVVDACIRLFDAGFSFSDGAGDRP